MARYTVGRPTTDNVTRYLMKMAELPRYVPSQAIFPHDQSAQLRQLPQPFGNRAGQFILTSVAKREHFRCQVPIEGRISAVHIARRMPQRVEKVHKELREKRRIRGWHLTNFIHVGRRN